MPTELFIDIETYSPVNLKTAGVYRYVEHPDFEVLMVGWAFDDDPVMVGFRLTPTLRDALADPTVVKVAHNANFERVCLGLETGPWHDTAAVASELGYPANLEGLSQWLGGERKDQAGTRLINYFTKPVRGRRHTPEDDPEGWAEFIEYCRQDVVTLRDVHRRLGDFPTETERRVYAVDQRINDRGMAVDLDLARAAVEAAEENHATHTAEARELTDVDNPGSGDQLKAWLRDSGLPVPDLRAETVTALLTRDDLTRTQRRVLELRQELAMTAAKKFATALVATCADGRLRGGFRFFGAHTGRWTGRGVQPHNLPREQLESEAHTEAAILDLLMGLGADPIVLKGLVRALFLGPLTVVDYASIEARVLAWMAPEEWALGAFQLGRDIYVETAERMSTPGRKLTRSQGKVAVLALGYNGGVRSLRVMGADGTDRQLQQLVDAWREANPSIVALWRIMGDAFRLGGEVGPHMRVEVRGEDRYLWLPSGRAIVYHDVKHTWVDTQFGRRLSASFRDPKQPGRVRTYGGKLVENATQAIARDVLAEALVRLDDAGYQVVAHVHDEIIVEGEDVPGVTAVMTEQPAWAAGLPIDGEGFTCRRYRKG